MAVTRDGLPKLVLAGAAAAPALLLFRALVLLRALWRQDAERAALLQVAGFAAAFGLAVALLLLALKLPADRRANLALALASAAAVAYATEVVLKLNSDTAERRLAERLQLVDEMGRRGEPAYPSIEPIRFVWARPRDAPSLLVIDGVPALPLSGRSLSRLVTCQDEKDRRWRVYQTDEHGFHNPPGLWQRAPVSLAAVGDSFTAGACVPSDASMIAGLRHRFPDAVNLGVSGSGPLLMLAVVREYLPAIRPRAVLWCHFAGNDLLDLRRERDHPLLRRYLEDGFRQGLVEKQAAIDRALDQYLELQLRPSLQRRRGVSASVADALALRDLRLRLGLVFADPSVAATDKEIALFRTVLAKAQRTVRGWGGTLHFVYLPARTPRSIGWEAAIHIAAAARARTLSVARELGLPVIDVEAAFLAHPDPESLFACPECHYTVAGYRLAADTILAELDGAARPR